MADADEARIDLGIRGLGPAEHIGRGGFADVYKAEQISLRRTVAVKVLRAQASDAETEARFERECHAIGAVSSHPHIVGVHEGGFTRNGRAYLVMEYLPGGSLRDQLDDSGPLPIAQVVEISAKIARALGEAHRAGVLHRDVKPANIMISAYGEPALGDFGIARIEGGHQTATGLVTASFSHAAPEVLEGKAPSAPADVYSLGTTIFELIAGSAPYHNPQDESIWPLMKRILSEPMPSPESVGMSQRLGRIFLQATNRDPGLRYQDADHMADELSALLHDPQSLMRSTPLEPFGTDAAANPGAGPYAESLADPNGPPQANLIAGAPPVVGTPGGPPAPRPDLTSLRTSEMQTAPVGSDATGRFTPTHGAARFGEVTGTGRAFDEKPKRSGLLTMVVAAVAAAIVIGAGLFLLLGTSFGGSLPGGSTSDASALVAVVPGASTGPLQAGQTYDVSVDNAPGDASFRLVVDGVADGAPASVVPSLIAETGRHSVAVEVTSGSEIETTAPVAFYALAGSAGSDDVEPLAPGFVASLRAIDASEGWGVTMATFDHMTEAGHGDLSLAPSEQIVGLTPGRWVLYVPGFGEDADAAEEYCRAQNLEIPTYCYAGYHQPVDS